MSDRLIIIEYIDKFIINENKTYNFTILFGYNNFSTQPKPQKIESNNDHIFDESNKM